MQKFLFIRFSYHFGSFFVMIRYDFTLAILFGASSIIIFVDKCLLPLANSFVTCSIIFFSCGLLFASPNVVLHVPSSVQVLVHSSIFLLSTAMLYLAINS